MMKALQITAPRRVEMVEIPKPEITAPDEVLVRMHANCICNLHEWKCYTAHYEQHFKKPYPLEPGWPGHEGSGEIVAIGPNVKQLKVGDHVFVASAGGPKHMELTVVPESWAFRMAPRLDWADIAPLELFACSVGMLSTSQAIADCRVAVIGLGPAGMAFLHTLRAWQPREIIAVDFVEDRLERALALGADSTVNANDDDAIEKLVASGPETAADCSGSHGGFRLAMRAAAREAVLFGYNDRPFDVLQSDWFWKRLVIRSGSIIDPEICRRAAALASRSVIRPSALVSHRVPFSAEGYAQAMELAEKKACCKVLMEFGD